MLVSWCSPRVCLFSTKNLHTIILILTPPTSAAGQRAVTQKFVTNPTGLTLSCGARRSWEQKPGSWLKWWFVSFFNKSPSSEETGHVTTFPFSPPQPHEPAPLVIELLSWPVATTTLVWMGKIRDMLDGLPFAEKELKMRILASRAQPVSFTTNYQTSVLPSNTRKCTLQTLPSLSWKYSEVVFPPLQYSFWSLELCSESQGVVVMSDEGAAYIVNIFICICLWMQYKLNLLAH